MARQTVDDIVAATMLSERLRIAAIIESPEGKARPALAAALALRNAMDAPSAIDLLKVAPEEKASAATSFLRALAGEAIGLSSLGAEVITDKKAARLAEIKTNIGKRAKVTA